MKRLQEHLEVQLPSTRTLKPQLWMPTDWDVFSASWDPEDGPQLHLHLHGGVMLPQLLLEVLLDPCWFPCFLNQKQRRPRNKQLICSFMLSNIFKLLPCIPSLSQNDEPLHRLSFFGRSLNYCQVTNHENHLLPGNFTNCSTSCNQLS